MQTQTNTTKEISLEDFFKQYPLIKYDRGEKILQQNELANSIIFIKSGFLKIYQVSKSGKEVVINVINAAFYQCLLFGIAPYIKTYSMEALSDVKVYRVPREAFFEFMNEHPQKYDELLLPLSRCLESMYRQCEWLKSGNAYFKIASVLHYFAKETGHTNKKSITIGFRITHQMIANFTGLTRETVTVQLNKLRNEGFIDYEDNILTINNMATLTHLLEIES